MSKYPGSTKVQGDFYTVMRPMVIAAVRTFIPYVDEHTQEDLVQDALLKLLAKVSTFNRKFGKLHSWATMLVKNLCVDYLRKKKLQTSTHDALDILYTVPEDDSLDTAFFTDLRAFFPFFCSTRVFTMLYEALERSNFAVTNAVIARINRIFSKNDIDPTSAGRTAEIAQFLVAMIRGWLFMHNDERQHQIILKLTEYPRLNVVRALTHYIGAKRASLTIFLLGGMRVDFPTADEIINAAGPEFR